MKSSLLLPGWITIVALALAIPGLQATGPVVVQARAGELSASSVLLPIGTARSEIFERVGPPDEQLSSDVWVYWNRRTNQPQLTKGYDTLLVIFRRDCVSEFKIVAEAPVRRFVAQRDRRNPGSLLMPLYSMPDQARK